MYHSYWTSTHLLYNTECPECHSRALGDCIFEPLRTSKKTLKWMLSQEVCASNKVGCVPVLNTNTSCGKLRNKIIGPCSFVEVTIAGKVCLDMLENLRSWKKMKLIFFSFQLDGAPPHYSCIVLMKSMKSFLCVGWGEGVLSHDLRNHLCEL